MMIWFLMVSILLPVALGNSEGEKWTWPSSQKDQAQADSRKDIYYESSNDKAGRIRVPTSYYDNRRLSVQEFAKCESFSFRKHSWIFKASLPKPFASQTVFLCKWHEQTLIPVLFSCSAWINFAFCKKNWNLFSFVQSFWIFRDFRRDFF